MRVAVRMTGLPIYFSIEKIRKCEGGDNLLSAWPWCTHEIKNPLALAAKGYNWSKP